MDSDFYNDLAQTALELLQDFGQTVRLNRITSSGSGSYDPTSGGQTTPSQTSIAEDRNAVVTDNPANRTGQAYGQTLANGTLLQRSDKWLYMDTFGIEPALQDTVVIQGVVYQAIDVQVIAPAGIALLYLLVVRK